VFFKTLPTHLKTEVDRRNDGKDKIMKEEKEKEVTEE
jgi:hypothetical protein